MVESTGGNNGKLLNDIGSYPLQKELDFWPAGVKTKILTLHTRDKMIMGHTKLRDLKEIIAKTAKNLEPFGEVVEMKFFYGQRRLSHEFDN